MILEILYIVIYILNILDLLNVLCLEKKTCLGCLDFCSCFTHCRIDVFVLGK